GLDNRGVAGATSGDGTRNRASTRGDAVKDQSERQSERNVIPAQMAWHGYLPGRLGQLVAAPAATGVASAGASLAQRPTVARRKRLRIPVDALQEVRVVGLVERHREIDLA